MALIGELRAGPEGTWCAAVGARTRVLFGARSGACAGRVFLPQVPAARGASAQADCSLFSLSDPRRPPELILPARRPQFRRRARQHAPHQDQKQKEKKRRKEEEEEAAEAARRRASRGDGGGSGDVGTRLCVGGSWGAHGEVWPGRHRWGPAHLPRPGPQRQWRPDSGRPRRRGSAEGGRLSHGLARYDSGGVSHRDCRLAVSGTKSGPALPGNLEAWCSGRPLARPLVRSPGTAS